MTLDLTIFFVNEDVRPAPDPSARLKQGLHPHPHPHTSWHNAAIDMHNHPTPFTTQMSTNVRADTNPRLTKQTNNNHHTPAQEKHLPNTTQRKPTPKLGRTQSMTLPLLCPPSKARVLLGYQVQDAECIGSNANSSLSCPQS